VPLSLKMKTNVFAKRWSIWRKFWASAMVHLINQTELTKLENEIITENYTLILIRISTYSVDQYLWEQGLNVTSLGISEW